MTRSVPIPGDEPAGALESPAFDPSQAFRLGVEEELLLVDAESFALSHASRSVAPALDLPDDAVHVECYAAIVELVSPPCRDADEGLAKAWSLRQALHAAGATAIGAGVHPSAAQGDVEIGPEERYQPVLDLHARYLARTPECALHVHVGMPDPETAIRVANGMREHLPLLQALAANSPFLHGADWGFASARSVQNRSYTRFEVPRSFASFEDYVGTVRAVMAAAGVGDYTYIWWSVRPHPRLGTVEVRAMDSQSSVERAAGLAALVHALARHEAERGAERWLPREVVAESCYQADRYGLDARIWHDGGLRGARDVARATLEIARPHARELGSEAQLAAVEQILVDGNGADLQRRVHADGGMRALLSFLVAEASRPPAGAG